MAALLWGAVSFGYPNANFEQYANDVASSEALMDITALEIAYQTDFYEKNFPLVVSTDTSLEVLEHHKQAEYGYESALTNQKYMAVSLLCFMEPSTAGCNRFNDMDCVYAEECQTSLSRTRQMTKLCASDSAGCFIVSLREGGDRAVKDSVLPWNSEIQWMDSHNCSAISFHLSYRCNFNLIKWDATLASHEWVDMDELFDAAFGFAAVAAFNNHQPLECSALLPNDQMILLRTAWIHLQSSLVTFAATSTGLIKFGASAVEILAQTPAMALNGKDFVDKLRSVLLINLFYDGLVEPFREVACALQVTVDYHPLRTVIDKSTALGVFYPGGVGRLSVAAEPYAVSKFNGTVHAATEQTVTAMDSYFYNVLLSAPEKTAVRASIVEVLADIEAF